MIIKIEINIVIENIAPHVTANNIESDGLTRKLIEINEIINITTPVSRVRNLSDIFDKIFKSLPIFNFKTLNSLNKWLLRFHCMIIYVEKPPAQIF